VIAREAHRSLCIEKFPHLAMRFAFPADNWFKYFQPL